MTSVILVLCGVAIGIMGYWLVGTVGILRGYDANPQRASRADLPPATSWSIRRARRAARADLERSIRRDAPKWRDS